MEKIEHHTTALDWTGPDDTENPVNWSSWKKIYHLTVVGLQCFVITFGSSVYTPSAHEVAHRFHVSSTAAVLPLTLYVIGLGFGPTVSAPISETFGRRVVYLFVFPTSLLFTLGAGCARNFGTLLACRLLAGLLGSGCLAVGAGSNSDMYVPLRRAPAAILFLVAPFAGPAFGPPVGAYVAESRSWRWTQWTILMAGLFAVLIGLPQKETYKKIILQQRAKRLSLPPPPNPLASMPPAAKIKFILMVTLLRPMNMLATEPIVAFLSIYTAFNFGVLFAFFGAFPLVFRSTRPEIQIYHFKLGESGLVFLAIAVGIAFAAVIAILIDQLVYVPKAKRLASTVSSDGSIEAGAGQQQRYGQDAETSSVRKSAPATAVVSDVVTMLPPEQRMYSAMVGSWLMPLSLFWFAWTARPDIHWIAPVLACVPFGCGNLLIFSSTIMYAIDTYGSLNGASAAAANGILRYVFGAVFPLFVVQMYTAMGSEWATSLLGFVTVALMPIPWVLFKVGPKLRSRSSYT